jgi:class 3 adenylate cyclase
MWSLTIKNPDSEPVQIKLRPGKMLIGRNVTSDIVITDVAASRRHAELYLDSLSELVTIKDMNSSNGTYVNRNRLTGLFRLQNNDVIRIGQTVMNLTKYTNDTEGQPGSTGTHLFTRELVLEAVDEHPILLYEMAQKLNTVMDIEVAIGQVVDLIKRAMGVDICEIILSRDFNKIDMRIEGNLKVKVMRDSSVEVSPRALCVPIMSGGKPLGLIYLEKNRADARPFDKRDMQLAVAVSHQTALTILRMELLDKVRKDEQVKQLLLRFVSPIEAETVLKDYLKTGNLPDLAEKKVTVLFVEIADSTVFAEQIGPKNFSAILNDFYQHSTQVVFRKGGMVKYLGDGVIAVFMETQDRPGPEERAVGAALEIIDHIKMSNPPEPDQACVVGVAINTGKAMVGYVGSRERAEFNVMGDLIKVTTRMQEYARPNRIFVGSRTAEVLVNKYQVKQAGSLKMIEHPKPIQVYEVASIKTAPFIEMESDKSSAFKEVAEKLKAHLKSE